ncbi:nicotinate-nucleotide adenylyltransferase [Butyrivibrio sp. NC3005]|uniref:nicotinate-nucleotide adenylyltransferase n=1 Tax=Butyrivibrio sp. NC3005 TaxID=1280685 RepID=UPI00040EA802|nr:nicotinate-nucleotide adenylyltransferase [Butyrivibrio sp. NC3005]
MSNKKIGIMGGTFNPIHNAHLYMAEQAREQFHLDRVIFIPSGFSYFKQGMEIPDGSIRYQLVKKAVESNPYFTVSRIEIDRPGDTYTIETLEQLSDMYPGDDLYFIMGADSVNSLDKWVRFTDILEICTILAAVRNDTDEKTLVKKIEELKSIVPSADIRMIRTGRLDISSTMIREKIHNKQSVRYLLPEECLEYIVMNNLYAEDNQISLNSDDVKIY